MASSKDILNSTISTSKNNSPVFKGNSPKVINSIKRHRRASDPTHRLERAQKCLTKGQLILIGDGLYETEHCKGCSKQHRVGNIDIRQCCKNWTGNAAGCNTHKQSCNLPSILSKPSTTSSNDSLSMIKIASQVSSLKGEDFIKGTIPFSREFCREMLNKEEIVLNERLLFERKLLEESERKHQALEQEESRFLIGEQRELEIEKEKFEHARKRRLALETILKTLNDIPERNVGSHIATTNSSRQKFPERHSQESCSSGGILRYNYSTASRKAVRIKGSSDNTTTESTNSSLSKYLTFASSQYLTTSSCSYNTDESSSNESVILVTDDSLKDNKETSGIESNNVITTGTVSSYEKRLQPTENFMLTDDVHEVSSSLPKESTTSIKDTVTSAPVLIGRSVTTKIINDVKTTLPQVDKAKSVAVSRGKKKVVSSSSIMKQAINKRGSKTAVKNEIKKNVELTIPSLIITVPSRKSFTQDINAFKSDETATTIGEAITEDTGSSPNNAPSEVCVTNPIATSFSAVQKERSSSRTTSQKGSRHFEQQPSNNMMIARSLVRHALEAVIVEYDEILNAIDSNNITLEDGSTPLMVSSDECLTETATTLVRNAIIKVQKDLLKPLDGRTTKSSVSFNFLKNLQPAKSIKKIFSF